MRTVIFIFLFCTTAASLKISAQNNSDKLIQELYSLWDGIYSDYKYNHLEGEIENSYSFYQYNDTTNLKVSSAYFDAQIKKAESEVLRKDWGLDWNSGYAINTAAGVDVSDNILYRSRVQSELSWNILNNGFIENKTKSDIKSNQSILAELSEKEIPKVKNLFLNWHKIIYTFNLGKIDVLEKRLALAKSRVDVAYKLNAQSLVTQEELIKNLESFAEIKSLLNIYKDYNEEVNDFKSIELNENYPLLDIDYSYAIDHMEVAKSDSMSQLMLKNLDLENRFINDLSLRTFARYNYYDLIAASSGSRSFFTFGLSVGIPLVFDKKETEQLIRLQKEKIANEKPVDDLEQQKDILGYFYEFRYKLKQFNGFYYKRLMMEELLRKEQARHQVNQLDFNPLKALRLLDEMMSIDIELIDLKQQMYLYILRIHSAKPHLDLNKLLKPLSLHDIEIKENVNSAKEMYVWSKTIAENDADFLVNFLVLNKVSKVIVSSGGDKDKLNSFISLVHKQGIKVDIMIGDNSMINDFKLGNFESKLMGISMALVEGIHLDVEPHTFDDWKENQKSYIEKYEVMLNQISNYCDVNELQLAVSIPTHYPEEMVTKMYASVENVYFMCYENVKTDFIVRKLTLYDMSKSVIALRPEDFQDNLEMEEKIIELKNNLKPKTFVIHDLGRMLEFK